MYWMTYFSESHNRTAQNGKKNNLQNFLPMKGVSDVNSLFICFAPAEKKYHEIVGLIILQVFFNLIYSMIFFSTFNSW